MLDLVIPTALFGTGRADVSLANGAIAAVIMPISFAIGIQWGLGRCLCRVGRWLPDLLRDRFGAFTAEARGALH